MNRAIATTIALVALATTAHAKPTHHRKPATTVADADAAADDDTDDEGNRAGKADKASKVGKTGRSKHRASHYAKPTAADDDNTDDADADAAAAADDVDEILVETDDETTPPAAATPTRPKRWSIEVGPSLWAASIASTIQLGPVQIQRNLAFAQIAQYLDGGMSGALDAHYDRFTVFAGFQFGRLAAEKPIGESAMIGGSITSVMIEAALGYTVIGADEDARVSLELRSGLRYNSLAIEGAGTLDVADTMVTAEGAFRRSGTDYLVGARAKLRLHRRVSVVATGDTRIFGDSYSTWSLQADLRVRAVRWLTLAAGWRVLETSNTPMTMHRSGPQLMAQVAF